MVPTSVFSGLTSSPCALARAAARLAIEALDRCMVLLRGKNVKADGSGLRALGPDAMPDGLLGVFWHQTLQFTLGLFMFEIGRTGPGKDPGKLRPGIG